METINNTAEQMPNIAELRQQIDVVDHELISALAKRNALILQVAQYKKANNMPRYQPDREKVVIESRRVIAEKLDVNPDLAEAVIKLAIQEAHRIEENIMGE